MKNNKQPEIRLSGHAEKWEWRKLNEISTKVSEKNKDNLYSETLTNSAEFGIVSQRDFFDKDISNKKNLNGYYVVRPDDFVYNPRISSFAPVGPIKRNKLNRTGVMSPLYYVFRTKGVDNAYLERYFSSESWHLFMKLNGDSGARSDRFAIKDVVFGEMPIPFPSMEEQKKIGDFFTQLDQIISLHQQELDTLKQTKQGFLQKMFPNEGESIPQFRFSSFNEKWKEHKLGELGNTFTGLSGKTKEDFGHGSAEFVTYMNVFRNPISDIKMTENVEVDPKQNELQFGDVLFTTSSETPHEVGMSSVWLDNRKNVYLNSFCFGYRPIANINPLFLAYSLRSKSIRKQLMLLAQGISRYNISKTKAMEILVKLPSVEEQIKIGNFFKQLDDVIALHQQELDALKHTKKAFLQKMFV